MLTTLKFLLAVLALSSKPCTPISPLVNFTNSYSPLLVVFLFQFSEFGQYNCHPLTWESSWHLVSDLLMLSVSHSFHLPPFPHLHCSPLRIGCHLSFLESHSLLMTTFVTYYLNNSFKNRNQIISSVMCNGIFLPLLYLSCYKTSQDKRLINFNFFI